MKISVFLLNQKIKNKKWGVRNKMRCKKRMDDSGAPRRKKMRFGEKKIGYLGYKEKKCSINKIRIQKR